MAITRKPKNIPAMVEPVDVEELINKGGSIARPTTTTKSAEARGKQVIVRVPEQLLKQIDKNVKTRVIRIPRHTWLIEAIMEKLERESA